MSETKFKEAKANLAFSQGLLDHVRGQNMAQPQGEMAPPGEAPQTPPSPQTPVDNPSTPPPEAIPVPTEAPANPKDGNQPEDTSQFLNIIEHMVETDKIEEERRLKEVESKHESDLKTIKDRVVNLLKRGRKK